MGMLSRKAIEAGAISASLLIVVVAGWASAHVGLAIGGVLQEFPIVTLVLAGLVLAIPIFLLLPLSVALLKIKGTILM